MLMCKEATRLMSLKQDRPLTFQERIALRLHLSMCQACRECDRQFTLLHNSARRFAPEPPPEEDDPHRGKGDRGGNGTR
ncbi:zf-HC2 domain-containing protein [Halomonas campisalis]|uniref:Zf-HC2 domain-containing protein n=1 Tax=Billgrantia campisalis TaxID=74661 RepID=A0ABS9P8M8_9GAMM|nr:zf-HC2 domain-containing protein [Halomonas campisalis]MCG6658126.1 zf-HC2 domain-containing protein [Halomonas campisalis]MDR5862793.1 zf-HC2 domain-containing protein [Halomonas campisalis]